MSTRHRKTDSYAELRPLGALAILLLAITLLVTGLPRIVQAAGTTTPVNPVLTYTNGVIASPTNFVTANSLATNNAPTSYATYAGTASNTVNGITQATSPTTNSSTAIAVAGPSTSYQLTLPAGSGAYTNTLVLGTNNATSDYQMHINLLWPTSTNPAVAFQDPNGTVIRSPFTAPTVNGGASSPEFHYVVGTGWVEFSKGELPARNVDPTVMTAIKVPINSAGGVAGYNSNSVSSSNTNTFLELIADQGTGSAVQPSLRIPIAAPVNPASLPHWRGALANVRNHTGNATVVCLGDSTTAGAYRYNSVLSPWIKGISWPTRLADALDSAGLPASEMSTFSTNYHGGGFFSAITQYDPRVVYDSNWSSSQFYGLGGAQTTASASGATITFTPSQKCNSVDIYYIKGIGSSYASANISVDGGSTISTISGTSGLSQSIATVTFPLGYHTIKLVTTSSLPFIFNGFIAYNSSIPSIRVVNGGVSSGTFADMGGNTSYQSVYYPLAAMAPNLILVDFGINDISSTGGNETAATMITSLTTIVANLKSSCPNSDIALMIFNPISDSNYTSQIAAYRTGVYALAATNGLGVIDLSNQFGSYANAVAGGQMNADLLHPTFQGYIDIANYTASQLVQGFSNTSNPALFYGNTSANALATPVAPGLYIQGTNGTKTYSWGVSLLMPDGSQTPISPVSTTTVGNATISLVTEFYGLTTADVPGAQYKWYRTSTNGTPSTTGWIGTTGAPFIVDSGQAGDGTTAPTTNTTGASTAAAFLVSTGTPAAANGTNATTTVTGTNKSGTLQVVLSGTSSGVITTLTLANGYAFPNSANLTLTPANAATANLVIADDPYVSATASTVVLNTSGTGMPAGTYLWHYAISGN
jgi:lysophospholipase L1-like esterase